MKKIFGSIQYNAPVVLTFSVISLVVLIVGMITSHSSTWLLFSVYRSSFADPLAYLRIFTHVLGHVSFEHFFSNFLMLLMLGPILEERYGGRQMIYLIVFTAFITGLFQIIFFSTALTGASGIVFMFMMLSGFTSLKRGKIPLTLILLVFIFIGREVFYGITLDDNISRTTHIIGGICGAIFGFLINKRSILNG
ncbi:MAG: rhomboid family intramembrane serine protease [Defluviitaleaceae bacterium]|nr:rhomboid family intramembrane serine protease [Defluviitaleaceae bacterium]